VSKTISAAKPTTKTGREYHLHTAPGDLSPLCLAVGAPGRADMIARQYFAPGSQRFINRKRGLVARTGIYKGIRMSVFTTGMGGASTGIALPEAVRTGARIIIRVGSCGSLLPKSKPGDPIVVTAAVRFDGASHIWAPPEFPAAADYRVVAALMNAGKKVWAKNPHLGIEATTDDFYNGQGRPDLNDEISPAMLTRHAEMLRLGVGCYSMEAATLFTWCATQGKGLPSRAINAVYAQRITNEFKATGDELVSEIALEALLLLAKDRSLDGFINRP